MKSIFSKILLFFIFLIATEASFAQVTIWEEDFESYVDGITNGTGSGANPANWSTNNANIDVLTVSGNKVLNASDTNTTSTWTTSAIDITSYTNVQFSLDVTSGGGLDSGTDVFRIQYRIDGGTYIEVENTSGDTSPSEPIQPSYSVTGLSGSTLDFRITMFNTFSGEFYRIDNVLVEGILAPSSCTTITSSPGTFIASNISFDSNISGFSSGTITDVNVTLNITHTWDSDLDITITSPEGTIVELTTDNGGSGDDYTNTIFDDASGTAITAGTAPFTGIFSPEGSLSSFNGEDPNFGTGQWILSITDDTGGDTGTLNSFSIEVCTLSPSTPSIDITNISINENAGPAVFTVTHTGADTSGTFDVDYSISAGSATQGVDYTTGSGLYTGTLTFNGTAGDTEQITVLFTDDFDVEPNETYTISFSNPSDLSVDVTDTATGTINNDDVAAVLQVANVAVDEDAGSAIFTVNHTGGPRPIAFTVDYVITAVTASEGVDYTTGSGLYTGTLNFDGTSGDSDLITALITDDTLFETAETYTISFNNPSDAQVDITDTATGTINDNEVILDDVALSLYDDFQGNFDYVVTGGTLRTNDNATDACSITTSSSGDLTTILPAAGKTIAKAYLYWAHSNPTPDQEVTLEGVSVFADLAYSASFGTSQFYGYIADVTSVVDNLTNPFSETYNFSGLTIDNTGDYCTTATVLGAWSLMIFYEDFSLPTSTINIFYGFDVTQNAGTSFTLDNFYAISPLGSKATFLSYEGDATLDGTVGTNKEELSILPQGGGTPNILTGDGGQTGNNAFNSTIYDDTAGVNTTGIYGLDLDTYDISSFISVTDTQVTANVDMGQDLVISSAVVLRVPSNIISGTVFEDVNYPGGAGRDMTTSSGIGIPNATVQLFDNLGILVDTETTDIDGEYAFGGISDGTYTTRIINSSLRSTRGGGSTCTICQGVQTYRSDYDGTTINSSTTEIGGNFPSNVDAAAGTLTGAQTTSTVVVLAGGTGGIDFGFNFNTIVNTNEDGQGSLEQFIVNSNNLDETYDTFTLDIETNSIFDPSAGDDTSIFMIPTTGDIFGRTADANYTSGYFDILISSGNPLSAITAANTVIDGRTQTAYSGNTNSGTIGSGGSTVGTSANILPDYDLPEIQVHRDNGDVLRTQGTNVTIRNLSVYGGNNAGIRVDDGSVTISNNLLGVNAQGANAGNIDDGVEITDGITVVDGNYIATNTDTGILIDGGTSINIQNNHITSNGSDACEDNITIQTGSGIVIQQNLIENASSLGIDGDGISGSVSLLENTITSSGQNGGSCSGNLENAGIRLDGNDSSITNNIIFSNGGAGIVLAGGNTSGNLISQNSIYANGTTNAALGIDLDQSNAIGDGVTLNDNGDGDNGPNGAINFPVIETVYKSGANLVVNGWSRPGATIEFFLTDISEGTATLGDNQLGFSTDYGEGQIFLTSVVEGSGSDTNTGISTYTDVDGNTDNTNRFTFTIPVPSATIGDDITATATIANSTSEFSPFSKLKAFTVITNRRITYRVKKN